MKGVRNNTNEDKIRLMSGVKCSLSKNMIRNVRYNGIAAYNISYCQLMYLSELLSWNNKPNRMDAMYPQLPIKNGRDIAHLRVMLDNRVIS